MKLICRNLIVAALVLFASIALANTNQSSIIQTQHFSLQLPVGMKKVLEENIDRSPLQGKAYIFSKSDATSRMAINIFVFDTGNEKNPSKALKELLLGNIDGIKEQLGITKTEPDDTEQKIENVQINGRSFYTTTFSLPTFKIIAYSTQHRKYFYLIDLASSAEKKDVLENNLKTLEEKLQSLKLS